MQVRGRQIGVQFVPRTTPDVTRLSAGSTALFQLSAFLPALHLAAGDISRCEPTPDLSRLLGRRTDVAARAVPEVADADAVRAVRDLVMDAARLVRAQSPVHRSPAQSATA